MLLPVFLLLFWLFLAAVLVFILALFRAYAGYLHLVSASSRCFSSCFNSSVLDQMVFALCVAMSLPHYIWMKLYSCCPIEGTGLCV